MKRSADEMASSWDSQLTKQQVHEIASSWDSRLTKHQVDVTDSWQNGKLMKWQVDKMASWQVASLQIVKLTKWRGTKRLYLFEIWREKNIKILFPETFLANCQSLKMSFVWNVNLPIPTFKGISTANEKLVKEAFSIIIS